MNKEKLFKLLAVKIELEIAKPKFIMTKEFKKQKLFHTRDSNRIIINDIQMDLNKLT